MNRTTFLMLMMACSLLSACKSPQSANSTPSDAGTRLAVKPPVLLIVMGGNKSQRSVNSGGFTDSVGSDLFEKALILEGDLNRQGYKDIEILQSSHTDYRQTDMVFFSFTGNNGRRETLSIDRYLQHVEKIVDDRPNHQVFLIGHSYGGWLALRAALKLQSRAQFKYLATIDAISRRLCYIAVPPPAGCTRFPQDFSTLELARLGQRLTTWDNFYQETTSFLHSAQFASATSNTLVRNAQHWEIDGRREVWQRIQNEILRTLRMSQ